ncbi:hypothetical protein GCM10010330_77300 [Streptomyces tendae]|nr:hypothetical protein GCM10010330_77300 [Streptomyces tendae]
MSRTRLEVHSAGIGIRRTNDAPTPDRVAVTVQRHPSCHISSGRSRDVEVEKGARSVSRPAPRTLPKQMTARPSRYACSATEPERYRARSRDWSAGRAGWSRTSGPARLRRELHSPAAPTPARSAHLIRTQLQATLKRAGRQRGIEAEADRLRAIFGADWAHQPALVEDAFGKQMLALLVQLEAACVAADQLAKAVEEAFLSTRTLRSSSASPASAPSSAPGCSPRSEMTGIGSPTPVA